ncbi:hypothetical protein BGZ75_004407 [Mortierella antarctica]|nr:hypothetical protein BGZ75_004407 [Mortierella antarctica]
MSAQGPPPQPPPGHVAAAGPGPVPVPVPAGPGGPAPIVASPAQRLDAIDEQVWLQLGSLAESMGEHDRAMAAYESALRHNYHSVNALKLIAELYRTRESFVKASEYFQRILSIDNANGEVWGSLGHCYLMMDELQKAYNAYQNALHHLPNPKDSKLWYGIGILYDRYGSVEHAEEAFSAVMRMDPKSDKANEIYFRLGIIYKGQQKYLQSLECFRYILHTPPRPLTEADIWFQIGHVHEQQKEYTSAKEAYERVLTENPNHAKVLQQLGWLYHQQQASFMNQDLAIKFLTRSIESDNTDAQSWYLMGRCYMAQQKFNKAYEAYQQAVYRDARNPTFWCSIGLLYFQINQYRDALDAYSKAIRINPNISEVWYDLGTLYESCNNQISDAIDAYQRASDLDPDNTHIKQRLEYLRQNNGGPGGVPPQPEEMNAQPYPPQDSANGAHPFGQNASNLNGEHSQPGRDLPLPGANHGEGNNNGHPGNGRFPDAPGSHVSDERQPHIPGINPGVPRPPTPAGAMPQMMSGPPPSSQQAHSGSGSGHLRPMRGRPQSPAPEAPYARGRSPGMGHPGHNQGHDPHYPPQHAYGQGHGPAPGHLAHDEARPGYDRHDPSAGMKQEQARFQHDRHGSADLARPGGMDQEHEGAVPPRNYPSDPQQRPSPPRDERRPPSGPIHPPHSQHAPYAHHADGRSMSPSNHPGRAAMDERPREGAHSVYQEPRQDREAPMSQRPPESAYPYPQGGNHPPAPHPDMEGNRGEPHHLKQQNSSLSRPDQDHAMEGPGSRRSSQEYQNQNQNQGPGQGQPQGQSQGHGHGHGQGQGHGDEQGSRWPAQRDIPAAYRSEQQDQAEIAASLVSLSGKPPQEASRRHAEDDDYDMEDAGAEQQPTTDVQKHQVQENDHDRRASSSSQAAVARPSGESDPHAQEQHSRSSQQESTPRPVSEGSQGPGQSQATADKDATPQAAQGTSRSSTPALEAAPKVATGSGSARQSPVPGSPKVVAAVNPAPAADHAAVNESDNAPEPAHVQAEVQPPAVVATVAPSSPTSVKSTPAPVESMSSAQSLASAPEAAVAPAEDEDTEMEEGEVREDGEL